MSEKTSKPKAKKIKADAAQATEPTAPKIPRDQRNHITRPREGTACRAIWDACDALTVEAKEITFEVLRAVVDSKTADATIRTQRQRWKQYNAEQKDGK